MPRSPSVKKVRRVASKAYRFDARLTEHQRTLIHRAAALEGRSVTEFVLNSAETAAQQTIRERAMLVLSARDTEIFVNAILRPTKPNPALQSAAKHYKRVMNRP